MLEKLQNNELIHEKDLGNDIHSFNFSRKAFYNSAWNEQTVTARGLFVDMNTETVFARSYNKFFNMDERKETREEVLAENLAYPVQVFEKENGYLGIMSVHDGIPHFFSKSTDKGWFAETFHDIFLETCEDIDGFCHYLEESNCSAVFEVISEDDPHFVDYYGKNTVILLEIIKNDFEFSHISYDKLQDVAEEYGLPVKRLYITIRDKYDFTATLFHLESCVSIEGFVLVDSNDFMFKLKTKWYRFWKAIRSRGQYVFNHLGVYTLLDIPAHRDLDYCSNGAKKLANEALSHYAFARDAGMTECPHVMQIMDLLCHYNPRHIMFSMV